MTFHFLAIEGPPGVGKTDVATRLAQRLDGTTVLEDSSQNPFLQAFHEGRSGTAFQAEVFFLLSRFRQQQELVQRKLFSQVTVCDYVFEKSKLYAYLNLEDNELLIYEKLYSLLLESIPQPELVVYLQAPADVLNRRMRASGRTDEQLLSEEYLKELKRAYDHYFFHYTRTPLLVVNTAELDFAARPEELDDLLKQISSMGKGTQYYVPLTARR